MNFPEISKEKIIRKWVEGSERIERREEMTDFFTDQSHNFPHSPLHSFYNTANRLLT